VAEAIKSAVLKSKDEKTKEIIVKQYQIVRKTLFSGFLERFFLASLIE
jgi:hypothetical protein